MKKQIDPKEAAQYISGMDSSWRVRPDDPYIYVSYSLSLFDKMTRGYSSETIPPNIFQLSKNMQNQVSNLIDEQWIQRANVPIKFLSDKIDLQVAQNKNIVFILSHDQPVNFFIPGQIIGATGTLDSALKYIRLPKSEKLDNHYSHTVLHETGHAILKLKHYVKYEEGDLPPFAKLDCTDSVMGYDDDCKMFENKIDEVKAKYSASKRKDPATRAIISKELADSMPNEIGPVDIEAAKLFNQDWLEKNRHPHRFHGRKIFIKEAKKYNQEDLDSSVEEYYQQICEGFLAGLKIGSLQSLSDFISELLAKKAHIDANTSSYIGQGIFYAGYFGIKLLERMNAQPENIMNSIYETVFDVAQVWYVRLVSKLLEEWINKNNFHVKEFKVTQAALNYGRYFWTGPQTILQKTAALVSEVAVEQGAAALTKKIIN